MSPKKKRLPSQNLQQAVRDARKGMGLSQSGLEKILAAHDVYLDASAISRIESGQRGVSVDEFIALCAAVHLSPADAIFPKSQKVSVTPKLSQDSETARLWLAGAFSEISLEEDAHVWIAQAMHFVLETSAVVDERFFELRSTLHDAAPTEKDLERFEKEFERYKKARTRQEAIRRIRDKGGK